MSCTHVGDSRYEDHVASFKHEDFSRGNGHSVQASLVDKEAAYQTVFHPCLGSKHVVSDTCTVSEEDIECEITVTLGSVFMVYNTRLGIRLLQITGVQIHRCFGKCCFLSLNLA